MPLDTFGTDDYTKQVAQLTRYASDGNIEGMKEILDNGVDPNEYISMSLPAIVCAAVNGQHRAIEYLVSRGADVNVCTTCKRNAFKTAASRRDLETVKVLFNLGADPNVEREGEVALTLACDRAKESDIDLIRLLLSVTDPRYYQRSYEYSSNGVIRDLVVGAATAKGVVLVEPQDGFGGPDEKMERKYNTRPIDPILAQIWELFGIYMELNDDPNNTIEEWWYRQSVGGTTNTCRPEEIVMTSHLARVLRYVVSHTGERDKYRTLLEFLDCRVNVEVDDDYDSRLPDV